MAQARSRGGGVEALNRQPPPGMRPRLSAEQRAQLPALLAQGAEAYGFRGDVWTARRVAQLIAESFACATIATTSVGCCVNWDGVDSNRSRVRRSATSRPSSSGKRKAGPPFEKSK